MFGWYTSTAICYTYLFNVDCSAADETLDKDLIQANSNSSRVAGRSRNY